MSGVTDDQISDAIARSLMAPVLGGLYLIGRRTLSQAALREAALQHAAPAMLSGLCAGEQYGWFPRRDGVVTVSSLRRMKSPLRTSAPMADGKPGLIVVRKTSVLDSAVVDGLPTASVPRALVEIAAAAGADRLRRAWTQADYQGVLDLDAVDQAISGSRRPGTPLVRALHVRHPGRAGVRATFNSPHEVDFRQLIADASLPDPEVNAPVRAAGRWYVGDFLWRHLGLIAELDDPSHDRPLAREADAARDRHLTAAGFNVLHFDTRAVALDPDAELARLGAAIAQRRRVL